MTTTIMVTKTPEGKLEGVGAKCRKALHKFQLWVQQLEPGEVFTMDIWMPRDPQKHKRHFAVLGELFDAQEAFDDSEHLRSWLYVGAGYATFLPGPEGQLVAVPVSIKWSKMDEIAFEELHQRVRDFLRSAHALKYLWPHLPANEASEIVEGILEGRPG